MTNFNLEHFDNFKQRLVKEKVALFNHLINYTFPDIRAHRVYTLNTNNDFTENTRKAGNGAHFRVTCWRGKNNGSSDFARYVYLTAASTVFEDSGECMDLRTDIASKLQEVSAMIVFEKGNCYSRAVTLSFVKRYGKLREIRGRICYCIPVSKLSWIEKSFEEEKDNWGNDFDYSMFHPEFIAYFRFADHDCHKEVIDVLIDGKKVHFDTHKAFYEALAIKGAKANTIRKFLREHKNFIFCGKTFILDPSWEVVEYKLRKKIVTEEIVDNEVICTEEEEYNDSTNARSNAGGSGNLERDGGLEQSNSEQLREDCNFEETQYPNKRATRGLSQTRESFSEESEFVQYSIRFDERPRGSCFIPESLD